ncbi:MAG: hypothetical protein JSW27_23155 [Phycisphaerales bacterium]|nr:MAG: hypothetical protein JSW27_23155 [Phycisphaerales bacterium]
MSIKTGFISGLVLLFFVLNLPASAQELPPAKCIPQDALICLHLSQPKALLELLAGAEMTEAITSLPLYQQQSSSPKFREFVNTIRFLETSLGTDWRTGLAQLTGGGITVAICPNDTVVAIVDAEDQSLLERLHEIFLSIARAEAAKQGHADRIASKEYDGVTAWTFDGNEAHAIIGKRLILANRAEALKTVLDLRAQKEGATLADSAAYEAAQRAAQAEAVATVFMNLEPFTNLPPVAEVLEKSRNNPLAALFFAGIAESFRSSHWLSVGLDIEGRTLTLDALTDGKVSGETSPAAFALPHKAGDGARPNLSVPRRIAALSLYRDLHDFYAAKDELFPERTSGLIFFENMMGIFFTGRDLTSEVLAETEPEVRLVVAEQQYDPEVGTPQVRLPAFAVILRLRDPEQFGRVAEEAWQKAVGLINFTRGQQALPGLIIDRPAHGQTKFTMAYFSTTDVEDKTKLETRFNVRPALAMPGDYLVLSSTDGLACDLIDALGQGGGAKQAPLAQTHSLLEVDGTQLASVLRANRESMVRQDMVKKGKTKAEAEAGIDLLITVVECIDGAKLDIGTRDGLMAVKLQAQLNLPHP